MLFATSVFVALVLPTFAIDNQSVLRGGGRNLQGFAVDTLQLIETSSNQAVATLSNNAVVTIVPGASYNINALTSGPVGSVKFAYNGADFRTESQAVWAFCGDSGGDFNDCSELVPGVHTVTATPYSGGGASGSPGGAISITFTLTTGGGGPTNPVPPPPVPAPIPQPTLAPVPQPTLAPIISQPGSSCKVPKFVGGWQGAKDYPIPAAEAQGAIIGNDFVVISGFTEGYGQATKKNYALDISNPNANWRPIADLPVTQGITHGAFVVVGSKFYMCGGYLGGHPGPHIDTCLVYNHATNNWSYFAPLPEGRSGGGMIYSSVKNELVFSAGAERPQAGNPNAEDYQHTWAYSLSNPGAGWVEKADIPYLTNHMSYATAVDQTGKERHFFLAGQVGENEYTGNVDDNYEWDIGSETWIKKKNLPFTRGHASSSTNAVNCGFIIAAGSTNEFGKTKDVSYYDVPSNTWTKIGDLKNAINTPVCDIDKSGGWYYCFTGWANGKFSSKIKIEL